ncbi:MAG: hemolysin family protein [Phocaeicola sp.]
MGIFIQILISMTFSAFFSGLEIAFVSSNKLRFEMDKSSRTISSRILSIFYRNPNHFISTMLVGNNIALVIYGILMAQVIEQQFLAGLIENYFLVVLLQTIISTLIILVTGEFLPKTLFKINPNFTLNLLAIPTFICYIVLYPISQFAAGVSNLLLRVMGQKPNKEDNAKAFTKVDLDYFIQSSLPDAESKEEIDSEIQIFQNAMDFSNIKARDCIVPRTEIVSIDKEDGLDELKQLFIKSGKSKVIVYNENIDNIIGYVHSSELFVNTAEWTKNIRTIPIVPETMSAHKLMKLFMQQKKAIAVVVDEFGGTAGIVALEDLVEEIFGEIEDEHDNTSYIAKQVGDNEYIFSGRLEIEKANELFNLTLPENDEYQTIGGLILNYYQSFPKANEVITVEHFKFKIIKVTDTKIELIKLKVHD